MSYWHKGVPALLGFALSLALLERHWDGASESDKSWSHAWTNSNIWVSSIISTEESQVTWRHMRGCPWCHYWWRQWVPAHLAVARSILRRRQEAHGWKSETFCRRKLWVRKLHVDVLWGFQASLQLYFLNQAVPDVVPLLEPFCISFPCIHGIRYSMWMCTLLDCLRQEEAGRWASAWVGENTAEWRMNVVTSSREVPRPFHYRRTATVRVIW